MLKLITTVALVAAGIALTPTQAQAVSASTCAQTPVVAHRGLIDGGVTENTRNAVGNAFASEAWVEVDLRETVDSRVVLMHDRRLTRTTNGTGRVDNLTARKIRSYRTDDGQRVPFAIATLRDVRDNSDAHIILDLKALSNAGQQQLHDKIIEYGIGDRVEAISRNVALLGTFARYNPGITTYGIESGLPSVEAAAVNGGAHVYPRLITESWADDMIARGVPYSARIDDTSAGYDAGVAASVTSIMSDDTTGYLAYCATHGP